MIIWDSILIKLAKSPSDFITAFALILMHYKADIMRCKNILQVVRVFTEKAPLLHDYDFYCLYFNYFKDKDMTA